MNPPAPMSPQASLLARHPGCHCHRGQRHGPHTYLMTFKTPEGRSSGVYVPAHGLEEARQGVAAWGRFRKLAARIGGDNPKAAAADWAKVARRPWVGLMRQGRTLVVPGGSVLKVRGRIEAKLDEQMNRHGLRRARYWGLSKVTVQVLRARAAPPLAAVRAPA